MLSNATGSRNKSNDGGLIVTAEMRRILAKDGFISEADGSQRLRHLYQTQALKMDPTRFSEFALDCYTGQLQAVQEAIANGTAPDLSGAETPYNFGYVALVVFGAQRIMRGPTKMEHVELLKFLLTHGAPPDVEDVVGYTALHHATQHQGSRVDLARILLENGADPNHQTRYGGVPILDCFQTGQAECVDLLMEFGADLSIRDADNVVPSEFYVLGGPKIAAIVQKWQRKRAGEEGLLDGKKCKKCGKTEATLKFCSKCRTVRYCSVECQRSDWSAHKIVCRPFNPSNTVTVKPTYATYGSLIPTAQITRNVVGNPASHEPLRTGRGSNAPPSSAYPKSIVIKVQVPWTGSGAAAQSTGDLLVYTKKREFVCTVSLKGNGDAYRRITDVVREKGVGGAKAYFTAELKSQDELVVKVDEVLAAQPF